MFSERDMVTFLQILILIVVLLLIAIALLIGQKLFALEEFDLNLSLVLKAILAAIAIVLLYLVLIILYGLIPLAAWARLIFDGFVILFGFIFATYIVRGILNRKETYERSMWITIVAYVILAVVDVIFYAITNQYLTRLL